MILQIIKYFQHRLIKAPAVCHPGEAVCRLSGIGLYICIEFRYGHSGICLGRGPCMDHVKAVGKLFPVSDEVPDGLCGLLYVLRRLILVRGVVKDTVFKQIVLEIARVKLTHKGAVHVESRNPVLLFNIIGGAAVSHIGHIFGKRRKGFAGIPGSKIVLLRLKIIL